MNTRDLNSCKKELAKHSFGPKTKEALLALIVKVYNTGYQDGLEELKRRSPKAETI